MNAFDEAALQAAAMELQQVRAEREAVEAQIQAIRTGRPYVPPGQAKRVPLPPPEPELPGGSIELPIVGKVPVLVLGAGVLAFLLRGGRK